MSMDIPTFIESNIPLNQTRLEKIIKKRNLNLNSYGSIGSK